MTLRDLADWLRRHPASLWLASAIIYCSLLTRTYYWDGVLFSLSIEDVAQGRTTLSSLFHPNHLLYSALGYCLYRPALLFSPGLRAIAVLQVVNALSSALAGYQIFRLSLKLFAGSLSTSLFCWCLFSIGATWWKFSTDTNSYILTTLFLTFSAHFLIGRSPANFMGCGVCHVVAMLFHELGIIFYVPVFVFICCVRDKTGRLQWKRALAYVMFTGFTTIGIYALCFTSEPSKSSASLLTWAASHSGDSHFIFSPLKILTATLSSAAKLFAGGKPAFVLRYWTVPAGLGLGAIVVLLVVLAYRLTQQVLPARGPVQRASQKTSVDPKLFLWTWICSYLLFLSMWLPWNAFYKLLIWPPIVLLIGFSINGFRSRNHFRLAYSIVILLAAWNFAAYIYPHRHADADPVQAFAEKLDRELPSNARVYYSTFITDDWYLKYFSPGRQWAQLPASANGLSALKGTDNMLVCLETTAQSDSSLGRLLSATQQPVRSWAIRDPKHSVSIRCY